MSRNWVEMVDRVLAGQAITRDEALAVLRASDEETPAILSQAYRVRRSKFENRVKLNMLVNIKSGLCPEDCHYCSQSKDSGAPIDKYPFLPEADIRRAVEQAVAVKAKRVCLVASGRGPVNHEVEKVAGIVQIVKDANPNMEVCCCLGLLSEGQGERLKEAGADAYNHNLNTSERMYGEICETHSFADRQDTVGRAQSCGLSSCSGALVGMGETDEDRVDVAFSLRDIGSESIPVNFLIPIDGTPLQKKQELTPWQCLRILCMFKLVNPGAELRVAGGRELHLRSLQPLALLVANSMFIGDYLTTSGQAAEKDLAMIRDMGFQIEGEAVNGHAPDLSKMVEFVSHRRLT